MAERQRRANGGGISAASAVRGHAAHKRRREQQLRIAVKENIQGFAVIIAFA